MIKRYINSFIHIPKIHRRERNTLIRFFPDLMKCKRTHDPTRILETIFYLLRSGCQWRLLPVCYLHWKSVYNKWRYRKGIKRHIIVDSQGNMLHAHTTCANINDGKVCLDMIAEAKRRYPSLKEMLADKGYRGEDVIRTAREHGMNFVCTKSNAGEAKFVPAQGRWVVERSISWLDNCRRLVRNYERECVTASYMTVTAEVYRLLRFI